MNQSSCAIITQKDILILKQLLEDGRKSSSSISKEIDLGREIINYRIKRLIKENLIIKFVPKINDEAMHYREYNILLKLNIDDGVSKESFVEEKIGNKYLIWLIKSSSGWDLMVRLYASSIDEFKEKLSEILDLFSSNLADYYTIISSDDIKESEKQILCEKLFDEKITDSKSNEGKDFNLIKKQDVQIDNKDKEIIKLLEENGRVQYKKIADKLNISSDTVKYRIEKLKTSGVIENFIPIINYSKIGLLSYAAILRFKFLSNDEEKSVIEVIKNNKNIVKAIKSLNMEEYFMNLVFSSEDELAIFRKEIEKKFTGKIDTLEIFSLN